MRRIGPTGLAAVVLVSIVVVGCGRPTRSTPDEGRDSGVRGRVVVGPQCPVQIEESPCPDRPWTGTVQASGGGDVFVTTTDANGAFTMQLAPGRWTMTPVIEGAGPPSAKPVVVDVRPHAFARVTLTVDTGIR